mmetsp:Transcript_11128/g.16277  ORF Transcript_11128/g.16277 Transcript_11128/m.16277 type:complete len:275 (-) Transcript_11128:104-928(-)
MSASPSKWPSVQSKLTQYVLKHIGFFCSSLTIDMRRTSTNGSDDDTDSDANNREEDPCIWHKSLKSRFKPNEMRCLALIANKHMKPAMKEFVIAHKELLKKFRLTGTIATMTLLRELFGNDPDIEYGPELSPGPLGGCAELCALICLEDVGGIIFFIDPLSSHPHQADIESLSRLANVHNVMMSPNPASAHAMCFVLEKALIEGRRDLIPSFFFTLESPGVKVYREEQARAVAENSASYLPNESMYFDETQRRKRTEREAIMESGFLCSKKSSD